jgi:hypothetical protein
MPRDQKHCDHDVIVARQRLLEQLQQLSKSFQR